MTDDAVKAAAEAIHQATGCVFTPGSTCSHLDEARAAVEAAEIAARAEAARYRAALEAIVNEASSAWYWDDEAGGWYWDDDAAAAVCDIARAALDWEEQG